MSYTIASAASIEQGASHAQALASAMINDLDPSWLVVCGIAGAVPKIELTLGDVVLANRLRDFSVKAAIEENEKNQIVDQGGPMDLEVQNLIALLPAMQNALKGWNSDKSIGQVRPGVRLDTDRFYGSKGWQKDTLEKMTHHFGPNVSSREPLCTVRTIVSGNLLVKDTETMKEWLDHGRDIAAVEMELSGVYAGARTLQKSYPILAVRGISDVVGFKRDPAWTAYACHSAAAFLYAFLRTKPIAPRGANHL